MARPEPTVIDDFTRDVLRRVSVQGRVVTLAERLRKSDFRVVREAVEGMGGRFDHRAGAFVFDADPSGPIGNAVATGRFTDRRMTLQLAETPEVLAHHVAELADIRLGTLVLEPSAGTGTLVRQALALGADVAAIELDHINVAALRAIDDPRLRVWHDDFLRWADRQITPIFDRVLMHPPFTGGADVAHVLAAWDLLKPDGRLVAIVSESAFVSPEHLAKQFRLWLAESGVEDRPLPLSLEVGGEAVPARIIVADRECPS